MERSQCALRTLRRGYSNERRFLHSSSQGTYFLDRSCTDVRHITACKFPPSSLMLLTDPPHKHEPVQRQSTSPQSQSPAPSARSMREEGGNLQAVMCLTSVQLL